MSGYVLVIDNDIKERDIIKAHLQKFGYRVACVPFRADPAVEAQKLTDAEQPDLLIIGLPAFGAYEEDVERWLSAWFNTPVMLVGAERDTDMMIRLLESGADDFVIKPYRRDEVLARARALIRRGNRIEGKQESNKVEINGLTIDLTARRAFVDERDLHLTRTEFALLAALACRANAVCTHDELLAKVWGGEYWGANHYLHVYFGRIRKKMGQAHSNLLETVPGMGYILHSVQGTPAYAQ